MGYPPRLARILNLPEMIQKRFQARLRQALKKGNAHGRRLRITAATESSPKRDRKPPLTRVRSPGPHPSKVDKSQFLEVSTSSPSSVSEIPTQALQQTETRFFEPSSLVV